MKMTIGPITYSKHYRNTAQGHFCLDGIRAQENKGFTISIEGAASMTQDELDRYAKEIVFAVNTVAGRQTRDNW